MALDRSRIPRSIHSASSRPLHAGRCKTVGGVVGCETTGWQDQAEMTDTVIDEINHDSRFEQHVQKVWKQNARAIPSFLPIDHLTRTNIGSAKNHYDNLWILTHCASVAPVWDPRRDSSWNPRGSRPAPACRLFTIVGFEWEL